MKHTISVLVENHAGVLSRVSGLFSRRGFNIDSLAVGRTDDPAVSRITIVADGDEHTAQQIEKQLNKLVDTMKVRTLAPDELLARELQLIKVNATPAQRSEILTICDIMGAKIIDMTSNTLTIEISDSTVHLNRIHDLLAGYGIKEIVRTGVIAIQKGSVTIK
ncbi:MAG: acetolactate synthase small subunit [Oscillospiraceae bacterium]|mgnify:CR=1|nr:acetolactate synthase small subunit [Oscillospiraceae bacterium]MCI7499167.1 acetolactate synthase small subunit [Oscillospiraceae bacterium]MDD7278130.1 acetolactate synthase small subunit [Oscillospiraceae bacterium]MDY2864855.1 acetolactate synthase small subunit [Oscillospiraceae bacterium]